MRMISYNILDGGLGRADPLAEVIEAQRADVVALIEADDADVVARIANRLDMDSVRGERRSHAVCLLSRWAIVESINHSVLRDRPPNLLEATVREPGGREWTLGLVHLHPRAFEADEAERERELSVLLEVFEPRRRAGQAHLLVGDFNANSPVQKIDPRKVKAKTRDAWEQNGRQIPRRVIRKMLDAGYLDSYHAVHPKLAASTGSFTTQQPGQRVDYIFTYGVDRRALSNAWIEQDRLAKYASDHFPIGLELT